GELGNVGAHARVQLAPQVRERPVQLVVKALARPERRDLALPLRPLGFPALRRRHVFFGAAQLAAGLDHGELGLAERTHGPIVAILGLPVPGVREALRADRLGELPHPALAGRELVLGLLGLLYEPLRAPGALLERGGLEGHRLQLCELGPQRVVSRRVVSGRSRGDPALEVARPPPRARELRARAIARFGLRPQFSGPRTGAPALLEHAVPLGLRILPVPHPHGALLLRGTLDRLEPLLQSPRRRIRPEDGLRHVAELGEAALEHAYVAGQLGQLRLFRAPRRRLPLQSLERRDLL